MPNKDGTEPIGGGKRGKRGARCSGKTSASSSKAIGTPDGVASDISSATSLKPSSASVPGCSGGKKRCGKRMDEFSNPEWWK